MLSFQHIMVVIVVVLVFYGAGKLPTIMGDLGKGIRSFKAGLEDGTKKPEQQAQLPPTDKDSTPS